MAGDLVAHTDPCLFNWVKTMGLGEGGSSSHSLWLIKGDPSQRAQIRLKKTENVQIFPSAGLVIMMILLICM